MAEGVEEDGEQYQAAATGYEHSEYRVGRDDDVHVFRAVSDRDGKPNLGFRVLPMVLDFECFNHHPQKLRCLEPCPAVNPRLGN